MHYIVGCVPLALVAMTRCQYRRVSAKEGSLSEGRPPPLVDSMTDVSENIPTQGVSYPRSLLHRGVSRPTPGGSPDPHLGESPGPHLRGSPGPHLDGSPGTHQGVSQHALTQTPQQMATAAGGMHPTGMHSC